MKTQEYTKLSNIRQVFWIGAVAVGARASQNTLLRHIPVTLGLRHPWLRTALGGRCPHRSLDSSPLFRAPCVMSVLLRFVDKTPYITPAATPPPLTDPETHPALPA